MCFLPWASKYRRYALPSQVVESDLTFAAIQCIMRYDEVTVLRSYVLAKYGVQAN